MSDAAEHRRGLPYRVVFWLAAAYNLAFAAWVGLWPRAPFALLRVGEPWPGALTRLLALPIAAFGFVYVYAALRPGRARVLVALGLLSKVGPPLVWLAAVLCGLWPARTFVLVLFDDLVWWLPFSLFLLRFRRPRPVA
ncbi:MAG TPA: hypothetical protein VGX48_03400 [Pyrinomonadaceae bacterium]|jgi:hypothetical protein|nr:hypothetical protein [Pyrinomonadaceae bacterium]